MNKVKLVELVDLQIGKTPSRSNNDYWGIGHDWLSISDLNNLEEGKYISKSTEQITDAAIKETGSKLIPENSILYSFKLSIGKTAVTKRPFYTNEAIVALSIKDFKQVNTDYLFYALKFSNVSGLTDHAAKGKTLNKKSLSKIEIFLPDLKYQLLAVSILDKSRIASEKRKYNIDLTEKIIRSLFLEMFGDPITNPKKFPLCKLSELGTWQTGGTPPRNKPSYFKGDIPWFSSGELNEIFIQKSKESINPTAIVNTSAKAVKSNSLLIGMYDTAALKSAITTVDSSCNQAVAFSQLNTELCDIIYVYYAVQIGKTYYLNQRRGARQKNLNLSIIKDIQIPLPPPEEQNKFADKTKTFLSLKIKQQAVLQASELFFESMVQKVFNGKLQDDDEIQKLLRDILSQQVLVDRLNNQDFESFEQYDLSKKMLFKLINTDKSQISQLYLPNSKKNQLQFIDEATQS